MKAIVQKSIVSTAELAISPVAKKASKGNANLDQVAPDPMTTRELHEISCTRRADYVVALSNSRA